MTINKRACFVKRRGINFLGTFTYLNGNCFTSWHETISKMLWSLGHETTVYLINWLSIIFFCFKSENSFSVSSRFLSFSDRFWIRNRGVLLTKTCVTITYNSYNWIMSESTLGSQSMIKPLNWSFKNQQIWAIRLHWCFSYVQKSKIGEQIVLIL